MRQFVRCDFIKSFDQFIFSIISWQMNPIETSITFRVWISLIVLRSFDRKPNQLISVAFKILKPKYWYSSCTSNIMKQMSEFLLVLTLNILPKPLDLFIIWFISLVLCKLFPVVHINCGRTMQYHLQLNWLKHRKKLIRYNFVNVLP